jgi:aspartate racemase
MKLIGLLGAVGWKTTANYYRMINEYTRRELGGAHTARILLHSPNSQMLDQHQRSNEWHQIGEILGEAGRSLKAGGADFIVLTSNSMHQVADLVRRKSELDLLHIAEPAGARIHDDGHQLVALIGTRNTMESSFYQSWLGERYGIKVIAPEANERVRVQEIIFDELADGVIHPGSRRYVSDLIGKLHQRGAQGIILGCSEITAIVPPDYDIIPVYDTTRLHARAAVQRALEGEAYG